MSWLTRILCFAYGAVFVYAGSMKLRDPGLFLQDIRSFNLLPDPFAAWLALGLPWLEVLAGLAVIAGWLRRGGLLLLQVALLVFLVAIGSAWHRGLNIECGCFGDSIQASTYVELIVRDVILLLMGGACQWLSSGRNARGKRALKIEP